VSYYTDETNKKNLKKNQII